MKRTEADIIVRKGLTEMRCELFVSVAETTSTCPEIFTAKKMKLKGTYSEGTQVSWVSMEDVEGDSLRSLPEPLRTVVRAGVE